MPRLLVIGARGFLGTFVVDRASHVFDVYRGDRSQDGNETDVVIDITNEAGVNRAFVEVKPDAVVLLAAISDIDRCQRDRELAVAVNLHGAANVANACARSGASLLFTSTGAVFDGLKHGYSEQDEVSPVSVYGETKAEAEIAVQALAPEVLILRVSLVLGRTEKAGTNSLLDGMISRWERGEVISASAIESRNPVDASTISQWIVELLSSDVNRGVYHAGATDSMTRYELAQAVAHRLNVPPHLVKPELLPAPGRAPRGADHLLLTDKISRACATPPPSCHEVIERSLNEVAKSSIRTGV